MNRITRLGAVLAAAVLLAAGLAAAKEYQPDPVVVGPDIYSMKFKNDRVRVSEATFKPGASIPMHAHPDHFLYILQPGTLRLSYPDGKTADFTATAGQVVWLTAESHAAVNTGSTEFKALVVELQ